jgi:hypothetical protein
MTTHSILVPNKIAAMDVSAYNRSAYYTHDIDNGGVFKLDSLLGTTGCEVWSATLSNGSSADMWMAYSPEVNTATIGTKTFRGLTQDQQDFYISACTVFDAFKPQVGDIITLTADAFSADRSTNTYANSADNSADLVWAAAKAGSALSLKLIDITTISKPDGTLGDDQAITAYKMLVVANPTAQ